MEKYTVESVMPTGKSHETFGTEFHVKFNENQGSFKLWYKNPPTPGQEQYGTINGWKFTKAKREDVPQGGSVSPVTSSATPAAEPVAYKSKYKDNSDGMRKGMAINNAATYVNAATPEPLSPEKWAQTVSSYAKALYDVSELEDVDTTVQDIFGGEN